MDNEKLAKTILDQIEFIRDTGLTNMFVTGAVKRLAKELEFDELAEYITKNPSKYCKVIMTGKVEL